jgi:protein tyrosine phosphatase (PTP) superfamily phosphohydrolase (DUF442 family)
MTDVIEKPAAPSASRASRGGRVILPAVIVLLIGAGVWVWRERFETYHLAAVHEGVLYRDGNRGLREFQNAVERVRPKTVVCLVDDNELADPRKPQFAREAEYLASRGVRLERMPIPLGGWPTAGQVKQFLELVQKPENQPVMLHCAQGVRRTGMLAAAYQQTVLKQSDQQARDAVLLFGRKDTSRSIVDVRNFIDAYDESTGEIKAAFAQPTTDQVEKVNWEKE